MLEKEKNKMYLTRKLKVYQVDDIKDNDIDNIEKLKGLSREETISAQKQAALN